MNVVYIQSVTRICSLLSDALFSGFCGRNIAMVLQKGGYSSASDK